MAKRQCKGKTKAGKRCRNPVVRPSGYCIAHEPRDSEGSRRFGGPQPGSGRPPTPRVVDVMRERVEEQIEAVLAPYFAAITEAVMFVKYEGDLIITDTPDLGARIAAAEKLLDRVYGKPRQTIEHAGPGLDTPIPVEFDLGEKAREVLADVLRGRPATGTK